MTKHTTQISVKPKADATQPATVVEIAKTASAQATSNIPMGKWSGGFFGCFTHCVPNCCMVTFCPCVSMAQIVAKLDIATYFRALLVLSLLVCVGIISSGIAAGVSSSSTTVEEPTYILSTNSDGNPTVIQSTVSVQKQSPTITAFSVISSFVGIVLVAIVWQLRAQTRTRYGIPGSCCCDCLASVFCSCCAIAQIATHVGSYTPGSCDFGAPTDTLPAYAGQ